MLRVRTIVGNLPLSTLFPRLNLGASATSGAAETGSAPTPVQASKTASTIPTAAPGVAAGNRDTTGFGVNDQSRESKENIEPATSSETKPRRRRTVSKSKTKTVSADTTNPIPPTTADNTPEDSASPSPLLPDNNPEQDPEWSMVRQRRKILKQIHVPASRRGQRAQKKWLAKIVREEGWVIRPYPSEEETKESESAIPDEVVESAPKPKFGHQELIEMAEEQRAERRGFVDRLREGVITGSFAQGQELRYQRVEEQRGGYPAQSSQMGESTAGRNGYPAQNLGYGDMAPVQYQGQAYGDAQQPYHDQNSQVTGSHGFGQQFYQNAPFPFLPMPMPMPTPTPMPMAMPIMPFQAPNAPGFWNQFNPQATRFHPQFAHPLPPFGQRPFNPTSENTQALQPARYSLRSRGPVSTSIRHKSTAPSRLPGPPAPKLAKGYLTQASHPPTLTPNPQPLLIILDLNGTLIFRKKRKLPAVFVRRPGLDAFLSYLFSNFKAMIWTSSQPETVESVVHQMLPDGERRQLVDIWARDTLGLTKSQYREKVQVYKHLNKVWKNKAIQAAYPQRPDKPSHEKNDRWNQTNTVLIDDSALKAIANPHNIIEIPEFTNDPKVDEEKNLHTVMRQLRILSYHSDVSQKLREWAQKRKQGSATVSLAAVDEFWDAQLREEEEKLEALLGRKLDALGTQTPGVDGDFTIKPTQEQDQTEKAVDETQRELDQELHISDSTTLNTDSSSQQQQQQQQQMTQEELVRAMSPRAWRPRSKGRKARRKESVKAKKLAAAAGNSDT